MAPSADQIKEHGHTFFSKIWLMPMAFVAFGLIVGKVDHYGLGYVLYRLTSDVEELPFPMAPVAAAGITALASDRDEKAKWRWRVFSIGGMMGLVFGAIYIGFPAITGAILEKPKYLIPIPWVDFTPQMSGLLPAAPMNITFDLGALLLGMVLPFWAVVGGFLGVVITIFANPVLHHSGILHTWQPQMSIVDTLFSNHVDFYLSFGIGLTVAITLVSIAKIASPLMKLLPWSRGSTARELSRPGPGQSKPSAWRRLVTNNVKRGDFSIFIALGIYIATSTLWIGFCCLLIDDFKIVLPFFIFYAVVYTPLISYATAKLEGICGQAVSIPMIREVTFILSGYKGVQIWFAPAPIHNYGMATVEFRVLELTGTKIKSQIKTQFITLPIIIVSSLLFANLLWTMAPVPSDAYPYAQKMWDLQAKNMCLTMSATQEGGSLFLETWRWKYFAWGLGSATASFVVLSAFGMPTLLVFGLVRGLGQSTPGAIFFEMLGALIGRFYFRRKYGDMWMKFTPVMLAGFSCGMGLVAMVAVAITILNKMMAPLMF